MKNLAPMGGQAPNPPIFGEQATPGPVLPYPGQPFFKLQMGGTHDKRQ